MNTSRRTLLALPALALAGRAFAQEANYPTRPIRLIVSYAPGGAADITARIVAPKLGERLGVNIVVENRTGGSGTVGGAAVAQAAPDGYTLLWDAFSHIVNPLLLRGLAFDYATAFSPISLGAAFPQTIAVKKGSPYRTLAEFIAGAKALPGTISTGHSGNGTASHLLIERFNYFTGAQLTPVPYRGGGEAARDLAAGVVDSAVLAVSTSGQLAEQGLATVLGVATAERVPVKPDIPTLIEAGLDHFVMSDMAGFFAPANTPRPIRVKLQETLLATLRDPEVKARFDQMVVLPGGNTPEEFGAWVTQSRAEMADLIRNVRITVE